MAGLKVPTCKPCRDPRRNEIDKKLLRGVPLRDVAGQTGIGKSALARHKTGHLPASLIGSKAVQDLASADSLGSELQALSREAKRLGRKAERSGNLSVAMQAVRELIRIQEVTAKVAGVIGGAGGPHTTLNLHLTPEHGARIAAAYLARHRVELPVDVTGSRVESPEPQGKHQQIAAGVSDGCPTSEGPA